MTENSDLFAFYIITENDDFGESAHGPYTMADAESRLKVDEKITTRQHLETLRQQNVLTYENNDYAQIASPLNEKMLKEIKNWGVILLIIGAIQVFASESFSDTWGLLLIFVGLSSFYFRTPAMFVVYGTTLSWAAISNALSGTGSWGTFSILQLFFAFQTFRQFFKFRSVYFPAQELEDEYSSKTQPNPDKAANPFPWASFAFGAVAFVGLITVFLSLIIFMGVTGSEDYPGFFDFMEGIIIDFAVIGFATGLASLLSRYKYKFVSIMGMIASGLVLLIEIGFSVF